MLFSAMSSTDLRAQCNNEQAEEHIAFLHSFQLLERNLMSSIRMYATATTGGNKLIPENKK